MDHLVLSLPLSAPLSAPLSLSLSLPSQMSCVDWIITFFQNDTGMLPLPIHFDASLPTHFDASAFPPPPPPTNFVVDACLSLACLLSLFLCILWPHSAAQSLSPPSCETCANSPTNLGISLTHSLSPCSSAQALERERESERETATPHAHPQVHHMSSCILLLI
jgi:hypothetical protein